jgi:hypothetical protein
MVLCVFKLNWNTNTNIYFKKVLQLFVYYIKISLFYARLWSNIFIFLLVVS